MKFHAPSSPWYGRTNAEVWFRTAEAAEAAGFANAESGDATKATDAEPARGRPHADPAALGATPVGERTRRTPRLT